MNKCFIKIEFSCILNIHQNAFMLLIFTCLVKIICDEIITLYLKLHSLHTEAFNFFSKTSSRSYPQNLNTFDRIKDYFAIKEDAVTI